MVNKIIMVYGDTKLPPPFSIKPPLKISADQFYIDKLVKLGFKIDYIEEDKINFDEEVKEQVEELIKHEESEAEKFEEVIKNDETTLEKDNGEVIKEEDLNLDELITMAQQASSLSKPIEVIESSEENKNVDKKKKGKTKTPKKSLNKKTK